jgi:hypothetical protein
MIFAYLGQVESIFRKNRFDCFPSWLAVIGDDVEPRRRRRLRMALGARQEARTGFPGVSR